MGTESIRVNLGRDIQDVLSKYLDLINTARANHIEVTGALPSAIYLPLDLTIFGMSVGFRNDEFIVTQKGVETVMHRPADSSVVNHGAILDLNQRATELG